MRRHGHMQQLRVPSVLPLLLLLLLAPWAGRAAAEAAAGLYAPEDGILSITTKEELQKAFLSGHGPGLLEFYVPSCPHCVNLAPELRKVARSLAGIAPVGAVDCSDAGARALCAAHGVRGFPTLKVFGPDLATNPYTGEPMKDVNDYTGARGARSIASAVTDLLHARHLGRVDTELDLAKFAPGWAAANGKKAAGDEKEEGAGDGKDGDEDLSRVLLFTDKPQATVLAKALSTAFAGRLVFAQAVKATAGSAAAALGVSDDDYPAIVVVRPDGTTERYAGELKAPPLREFLEGFAAPAPAPGKAGDAGGNKQGSSSSGSDGDSDSGVFGALMAVTVEPLTPANLTALDADELAWVLAVYSSGGGGGGGAADDDGGGSACKAELAQFNATARAAQAVVRYGALDAAGALGSGADAAAVAALKELGVDLAALAAAPCALQVLLLPFGAGKAELAEYQRYTGPLDDGKALQAWALADTPDTTVLLASEAELRAFMAPLPGGPAGRALLFASKAEAPAVYKALALSSAARGDGFAFAWVSAGADGDFLAAARKMMHVSRTPALLAAVPVPAGVTVDAGAGGRQAPQLAIQPYPGPLKYALMSAWLKATGRMAGISKESPLRGAGQGAGKAAAGHGAPLAPVQTHEELKARCYDAGTALCLMAVVDARNAAKLADWTAALEDAAAAAAARHPGLVSFVMVDAGQPRVMSALGLSRRDLPAIAAVSAKRMRFALAPPHAKFGAPAVAELLAGVMAGKVATVPLDALPELVDAADGGGDGSGTAGAAEDEQPDGEDAAAAAAAEDEFDLSEVLGVEGVGLESKEAALKRAEEELAAEEKARKEAEAAAAAAAAKKKKAKSKKKKAAAAAKKKAHDEL